MGPLSVMSKLLWFIRLLWQTDPDSRRLLLFTACASIWSLLQLMTSFQLGSPSLPLLLLTFASFHLLHMTIEFAIGLASVLLVTRKSNFQFSFGYDRIEVLLRFSNAVFLLFLCLAVSIESFQHFLELIGSGYDTVAFPDPSSATQTTSMTTAAAAVGTLKSVDLFFDPIQKDPLLSPPGDLNTAHAAASISLSSLSSTTTTTTTTDSPILGLLVVGITLIGITLKLIGSFHKHYGFPPFLPSSSSSSSSSSSRFSMPSRPRSQSGNFIQNHQNLQRKQLLISMFSDVLSFVAVLVSQTLVRLTGYEVIEPLLALICAFLIAFLSGLPDLSLSSHALLQTTSPPIRRAIDGCVSQIKSIDGVVGIYDEHFWTLRDGVIVGSLAVRIKEEADEQKFLIEANKKLGLLISHLTIQVEKGGSGGTDGDGDGDAFSGSSRLFGTVPSDKEQSQLQQLQQTNHVAVPIEPQLIRNFMSDQSLHLFGGFGASHVCSDCSISSGGGGGSGFGGPTSFVARVVTPSNAAKFGGGSQLNMNSVIIPSSSMSVTSSSSSSTSTTATTSSSSSAIGVGSNNSNKPPVIASNLLNTPSQEDPNASSSDTKNE